MSEIKVGDMVRLVWACCGKGRRHIGWVGTVEQISVCEPSLCFCGYKTYGLHACVDIGGKGFVPLSWLVKIDPPAETERVERGEEIPA